MGMIMEYNKEEALRLKKHFESKGYIFRELKEEIVKTTRTTKTRYTIECIKEGE